MTTLPVPVSLIGPNVAQVRPMVHVPAQPTGKVVPQTVVRSTPRAANTIRKANHCGNSLSNLPSATVPPGRYRYTTASVNGQQGVFLVPLSTDSGNENSKVFVPFTSTNPSPITSLIMPPGTSTNPMPGTCAVRGSTPTSLVLPVSNLSPEQTAVPTGSFMNTSIIGDVGGNIIGTNAGMPGSSILKNLVISGGNHNGGGSHQAEGLITQQVPLPTSASATRGSPALQSRPTSTGPVQLSSLVVNVVHEKPTSTKDVQPSASPTPAVPNSPSGLNGGEKTATLNPSANTQPLTLNLVMGKPNAAVSPLTSTATLIQGNTKANRAKDSTSKAMGAILIPQSTKSKVQSLRIAQRDQKPEETNKAATPPSDCTDNLPAATVKEEIDDTQGEKEEDLGFKFKIDSVFSLSSGFDEPVTKNEEPVTVRKCEHQDTAFVVLQDLQKLQHLTSVDVRKFRKLTGRQSCSKKCRLKATDRLCRLQKLCLEAKASLEPDAAVSPKAPDSKLDEEQLKQFEFFASRCKPAPRARKLKLFLDSWKTAKATSVLDTLQPKTPSPGKALKPSGKKRSPIMPSSASYLMSKGKAVAQEVDPATAGVHDYANKAVSLLNPGSRPVQGWVPMGGSGGQPPPTKTTPPAALKSVPGQDPNSDAVLKAASSIGSKKFYLIKVEGKNILIPVEQSGIQPRAYILGNEKGDTSKALISGNLKTLDPSESPASVRIPLGTSASGTSPTSPTFARPKLTSVQTPPFPTKVTVKAERVETGHEGTGRDTQQTALRPNASAAQVRIKPEPMRGYADEDPPVDGPPRLSPPRAPPGNTRDSTGTDLPPAGDGTGADRPSAMAPLTGRPALTASADRIRKLKEMLRKNEEELEIIKKRRKEEAVDISTILDSEDL